MAMISLSAASRLRPSRMPTSTAMGMVTLKVGQSEEKNLAHIGQGGAVAHHHLKDVGQVAA